MTPGSSYWNGRADVDQTVESMIRAYKANGSLPPEWVQTFKRALPLRKPGLVMYFFDRIARECPELLREFAATRSEKPSEDGQ